MFSYVKKVFSSLLGINDTPEDELVEDKFISAINSINLEAEISSNFGSEEFLGQSDPVTYPFEVLKFVHKSGKVTHLCKEYGLIDNVVYFVSSQVSPNIYLRQNDEVLYTAYRAKENESERVCKIYGLKKDSWDNDEPPLESVENSENTNDELKVTTRYIPGRVIRRKGRNVYIETLNTWCNLDRVQASFIPIEGDWITVETVVAFNEDVANFVGDIIEIKSIGPLIKKSSFGRITLWSLIKKEGLIENSVFFSALECESGYIPSLGDHVVYDAIESDQDTYKWRALLVYPCHERSNRKSKSENCQNVSSGVHITRPFDDKNEISISPTIHGVDVEMNCSKTIWFEVTNKSPLKKCLKSVSLTHNKNNQLILTRPLINYCLMPEKTVKVYLTCSGKFLGLSGEICIFRFDQFIIARKIEINVLSTKDMNKLLNYKLEKIPTVFQKELSIEESQKPDIVLFGPKIWTPPKFISGERKYVFKVPKKLQEIADKNLRGIKKVEAIQQYAPYTKFDLNVTHYADRFHTFLYLEELELRMNFRKYNMDGVFPRRCGEFFSIEIPGLVGRRPSVIVGDSIKLTQPWSNGNRIEHVGFIHEILQKEVFVKFHPSFHDSYDGSECNIKFVPNTFFFARCHEAIARADKVLGKNWLFPSSVNEKQPQVDFDLINFIEEVSKIKQKQSEFDEADKTVMKFAAEKRKKKSFFKWVNKDLNERQKLAVVNVLKGVGRPLPYIIFGPPGTGKTVTLIEIIIQIYLLVPESRILVTTPSNSAADLICSRLIDMINIKPGQLIRFTSITKVKEGLVPEELRPYTSFYVNAETQLDKIWENENLRLCSMNELTGKHKVTVSTCTNIGKLHFSGFTTGHFTHILVDEAGQATEPETLISVTFQNIQNGQVVLAGDPEQLGPVVCSSFAKSCGFGESLLQRLTKTFPYLKDVKSFPETSGFDPRFITWLNINYRSVPEILSLISQMFYNSELMPTVSQTDGEEARIIEKFNFMEEGRERPAALIFHGIIGQNYQESDSPSWFNPHEIWQVVLYLKKLYSIGLKSSDVGIITPYSKQVKKLQDLLLSLKLVSPKIGTVEEYQGCEKKVIILSTVRSSLKFVRTDIAHHMGFVACPKRLNVSLSRARALLIIVGNPVLLSTDPYWVTVIKYCIKNKSYTGCNLNYFDDNLELELEKEEK